MPTILDRFYSIGGYVGATESSNLPHYVSTASVTGTYLPFAEVQFNKLCGDKHSVSVIYTGTSAPTTNDPYDDRIITHLALAYADMDYDKIHTDPDTGAAVNRHADMANNLMLQAYGARDRYGRLVFPVHADQLSACSTGYNVDLAK
jgi:hypothetical protein